MYTGIYFLIEAIFYSILLMIAYFRKKVFNSKENRVYSVLVVISFFELLLEFVLDFVGPMYLEIPKVSYFIARMYSLVVELWITILLCYVIFVCLNMTKKEKYIPLVKNIAAVLMIMFATLNFVLPLNFMYDGYIAYTYGPSVNIIYISAFLYSFIGIATLIINIKNIRDRRFFPILLFLILGGIASYIQYVNPGLLLATPIHAFITFIMYFTIENPDVKMIEQYHKTKEIMDNANKDKTMFLYNMTNDIKLINKDINNNVNKIMSILDAKRINKDYLNKYLRNILVDTAKFTTMTNEVFDVSSLDSANIKIYNDKYNIKLLLKKIITLYSSKCKDKGIEFRSDVASDIPTYLYGDSVGLRNVLVSILDNSVKYTINGYIEFSTDVIIKNGIARVIITISDSGCGILPEELDKIFYKNKEEIDGDNIKSNLYTARKLITLMGGVIIPNSNYGEGTTMRVVLDQKIVDEDDSKISDYEKVYDKKKILLVDDSDNCLKIITKMLKDTNILVDYVGYGKEALDRIRNNVKYDLILLEEKMEPLNGFDTMNKLNGIKNFDTDVILLTRNNDYEYNDSYLDYGFKDYLLKPIKKDDLFKIIDKYLK